MSCGCKKISEVERVPNLIRITAKNLANADRTPYCIIYCTDWDFCTLENAIKNKTKIIEIVTPL